MSDPLTNSAFNVTIKGAKSVKKYLDQQHDRVDKAMNTALRVEGFRLKKELQQEIRRGAPGGRTFAPLSFIARRIWRRPNRTPLDTLAKGVRYDVPPRPPYNKVAVGFVGPMTWSDADTGLGYVGRRSNQYSAELERDASLNPLGRGISRSKISSKRWRALATIHQDGFTREISKGKRWWIIRRGSTLVSKSSLERSEISQTPFFLKKTTRKFTTPARPIITPFWQVHKPGAIRNIDRNFYRKMAGQRI